MQFTMKSFNLLYTLFISSLFCPVLSALAGHNDYRVVKEGSETLVYTNGYKNGRDAVTMVAISSNKIM
ncbi:hypothetical protein CH063_05279, partial [Colletotrichum higginsianum]